MVPSWGNVIGGAGNVLDLHLGGSYRGGVHRGKCITLFSFRVLSIYIHIRVCNKVTCNLTSTRYLFPVTAAGLWGPGPAFVQPASCCKKKRICNIQLTEPQPASLVLGTCHPRASPFSSTQHSTHASRLPRASVDSPSCRAFFILGKPTLPTQALPVCRSLRWALLIPECAD